MIDDLNTAQPANIADWLDHPKFEFSEADIVSWDGLWAAVRPADRVYHLAAVVGVRRGLDYPIGGLATNIAGRERLLPAALAGGRRPRVRPRSTSQGYAFSPNRRPRET